MKKTIKLGMAALVFTGMIVGTASCKKYRKYDDNEVVENTFTGNIDVTSTGSDPAGDFTGSNKSGKYSFAWENSSKTASANFDITSNTGSVQMILNDARGKERLNKTLTAGGNDTFAGLSEEGSKGKWLVTLVFTNFNGDGSYSLNSGN